MFLLLIVDVVLVFVEISGDKSYKEVNVFFIISIFILSIFMLEIAGGIFAARSKYFTCLNTLDAIIVATSFGKSFALFV
jgi:hypothetical protein